MLIDVLTVLHAVTGVLAFGAGVVSLGSLRLSLFWVFLWCTALNIALMYLMIVLDWPILSNVLRQLYLALSILGGYMVFRAGHAATELNERFDEEWHGRFAADVGFTTVALGVGFVIVAVMDMHAAPWAVAVAGLAAILIGSELLRDFRRRHGLTVIT
jgi:hypothetical protein